MQVRVLGSAAGGGFPQWNCNCRNCAGLRTGELRAQARTQSSVAVSADGISWVLINCSPDIRAQLAAFPGAWPANEKRKTSVAAIILVDSQLDHSLGLLSLREGSHLHVYATPAVMEDLRGPFPVFNLLNHYCEPSCHPLPVDPAGASVELPAAAGLNFTVLPIAGKAPPYSPHRQTPQLGDNIALLIEDRLTGGTFLYAPNVEGPQPRLESWIARSSLVFFDGTFWQDDEMERVVGRPKLARAMGHWPLSGADGSLAMLARYSQKRRILIHINNTNPILDESSPERAELSALGIEVAYDGMEVRL